MSKIGKLPVELPSGVTVEINGRDIKVTGPKGVMEKTMPREVEAVVKDNQVVVSRKGNNKFAMSLHGTYRSLINNMVKGVSEGYKKQLELIGTGFRPEVSGNVLTLIVGYSHPVKLTAPEGITFKTEKMVVTVEGVDKEVVGEMAAQIRKVRPPEPYNGKGIKYVDEVIRRKAGKAAAKTAGGAA